IGQSAGSMNCSNTVYAQPEENEEFNNPNFDIKLKGLGLVNFSIMPHMNFADEIDTNGHPTVMQMCLKDSFEIPHYGICDYGFIEIKEISAIAYGKTLLIKDGQCIKLCDDGETIELNGFEI
ncbi:Type 1 glutamine amidotransferase-like domain-containing protein, partial [bacterium]|nr:Type 1 glutamine amidotransferase-like domain-containing protein [bacterium]